MSTPQKVTAKSKLESSHLDDSQLELMDVDTNILALVLTVGERMGVDLLEVITDIVIERTIEGASTVTVSVIDYERKLLRYGNLKARQDVQLNGLWFRLAGVNKTDDALDLVFEEREIAVLRTYNKKLGPIERSQITRAEFILRMIKEPKEIAIKWVIPELHTVQPIEKDEQTSASSSNGVGSTGKEGGIPDDAGGSAADAHHHPTESGGGLNLTVKGEPATREQIRNANIILGVGSSMLKGSHKRKILISSIMTAIQESRIINLEGGDGTSVGVFQQTTFWGSYSDRHNVATAARQYFIKAIEEDKKRPNMAYYELCQAVQRSAYPNAYAQWRTEGERFVTAYGVPGNDDVSTLDLANAMKEVAQTSDGAYYFYRGIPPTVGGAPWHKEDSWTCIQRLSDEVNWRAFFVSGTFYFMDEFTLFRSKPRMIISEEMEGVGYINFNYDNNKKAATITFRANLARWGAPPGSVVMMQDMGPVNGRWIVENVRRSVFSPYADITISKPRPELPEPLAGNLPADNTFTGSPTPNKKPGTYKTGTATVQPVPGHHTSDRKTHDTLGGYNPHTGRSDPMPAIDFLAPAGSDVVAPVSGTIIQISGKPTSMGAWEGAGGPFGRSVYILTPGGTVVYITHLDDGLDVKVGQHVDAGQVIGQVGDYPGSTPDHVHVGVSTGSDGITVHTIANSPDAQKQ